MYVTGVGNEGKRITIADGLSIHLPYGAAYWTDEKGDYSLVKFKMMPAGYGNKTFDTDEKMDISWKVTGLKKQSVTIEDDISEANKKMPEILEKLAASMTGGEKQEYEMGSSTKVKETDDGFTMTFSPKISEAGGGYKVYQLSEEIAMAIIQKKVQLGPIVITYTFVLLALAGTPQPKFYMGTLSVPDADGDLDKIQKAVKTLFLSIQSVKSSASKQKPVKSGVQKSNASTGRNEKEKENKKLIISEKERCEKPDLKTTPELLKSFKAVDIVRLISTNDIDIMSRAIHYAILCGKGKYSLMELAFTTGHENPNEFSQKIWDLSGNLGNNETLYIPSDDLSPQLRKFLWKQTNSGVVLKEGDEGVVPNIGMDGTMLLYLFLLKKIMLKKDGENRYIVYLSQNLAEGLPDCKNYIKKFITTLRNLDEENGSFSIQFRFFKECIIDAENMKYILEENKKNCYIGHVAKDLAETLPDYYTYGMGLISALRESEGATDDYSGQDYIFDPSKDEYVIVEGKNKIMLEEDGENSYTVYLTQGLEKNLHSFQKAVEALIIAWFEADGASDTFFIQYYVFDDLKNEYVIVSNRREINIKKRKAEIKEPDELEYSTDEIESLDFQGKTFVLTGEFCNCKNDRDEIKNLIVKKGGRCTTAVSGKTDYLVLGSLGGVGAKKVEKMQELQSDGKKVKIISEETLFRFLHAVSHKGDEHAKVQNQKYTDTKNERKVKINIEEGLYQKADIKKTEIQKQSNPKPKSAEKPKPEVKKESEKEKFDRLVKEIQEERKKADQQYEQESKKGDFEKKYNELKAQHNDIVQKHQKLIEERINTSLFKFSRRKELTAEITKLHEEMQALGNKMASLKQEHEQQLRRLREKIYGKIAKRAQSYAIQYEYYQKSDNHIRLVLNEINIEPLTRDQLIGRVCMWGGLHDTTDWRQVTFQAVMNPFLRKTKIEETRTNFDGTQKTVEVTAYHF